MNEYLNLIEFIKHLGLNMVLNNEIIKYGEFELLNRDELWEDFILDIDKENLSEDELEEIFAETVEDVYQYYIVPEWEIDDWLDYTDYPLYYSEELDMSLVGITHFGIGWEYFDTTYPCQDYVK